MAIITPDNKTDVAGRKFWRYGGPIETFHPIVVNPEPSRASVRETAGDKVLNLVGIGTSMTFKGRQTTSLSRLPGITYQQG